MPHPGEAQARVTQLISLQVKTLPLEAGFFLQDKKNLDDASSRPKVAWLVFFRDFWGYAK
jgi:hypothetical protein